MSHRHAWVVAARATTATLLSVALTLPMTLGAAASTTPDPRWSSIVAEDAADATPAATGDSFRLIVRPSTDGFPGGAFPGQRCIFLVVIKPGDSGWRGHADVTATASEATVKVKLPRLGPGLVGEVVVIPAARTEPGTITVTISARHAGVVHRQVRTIEVWPEQSTSRPWAREILGHFLPWLERHYPQLGLGPETRFFGTVARPHWLIVMRYVFLTPEWEIGVQWHVMIKPDDWAQIYLRHRWTDRAPSFAAEITSVMRGDRPHEIAPTNELYR